MLRFSEAELADNVSTAQDLQGLVKQLTSMHTAMHVIQAERNREVYEARMQAQQLAEQLETAREEARQNSGGNTGGQAQVLAAIDNHLHNISVASSEVASIARSFKQETDLTNPKRLL